MYQAQGSDCHPSWCSCAQGSHSNELYLDLLSPSSQSVPNWLHAFQFALKAVPIADPFQAPSLLRLEHNKKLLGHGFLRCDREIYTQHAR